MEIFAWIMMGIIVLTLLGMTISEHTKKHCLALNLTKALIVEILLFFVIAVICGITNATLC